MHESCGQCTPCREGAGWVWRMLARMAELSGGRSLGLNVDLVINNARVAAEVAKAFRQPPPDALDLLKEER